jgi:hypothetical protein
LEGDADFLGNWNSPEAVGGFAAFIDDHAVNGA